MRLWHLYFSASTLARALFLFLLLLVPLVASLSHPVVTRTGKFTGRETDSLGKNLLSPPNLPLDPVCK